jgi:hypothetical protein
MERSPERDRPARTWREVGGPPLRRRVARAAVTLDGETMSFFGRLARALFGGAGAGGGAAREDSAGGNAFWLYVRCKACGEAIRVRIHREHDLSADYDGGGSYYTHKEIVGRACFRRIKVDLTFDGQRQLAERTIEGGDFITREEYQEYEAAQAAEATKADGSPGPAGTSGG